MWRLPALQLLVAYTLPGFTGFLITSASLPAWLAAAGTATSVAGLVTTVLLVVTVGTQLLVPAMVQRWGMAPVLAGGAVALGGPSLLLLVDDSLGWALGISAVRGAGFAVLTVLGSTLAGRVAPPSRRGEAIGIYGLGIAVPNLLAVAGGVALVTAGHFAWVAVLGAAPLLGLFVTAALARHGAEPATPEPTAAESMAPEPAAREPAAPATSSARAARRAAMLSSMVPAAVLLVVTVAGGGLTTFLPIALPVGSVATVALLLFGLTGAAGRWWVGLLADRHGMGRLLPGSTVLAAGGLLCTAGGLALTGGPAAVAVLVGAAVLGIGYGATQNLTLVSAFARAGHRETATVSSVWNVGFDAGTAIGAGAIGALTPWLGVPGAYVAAAVVVLAATPLAMASGRAVLDGPRPR